MIILQTVILITHQMAILKNKKKKNCINSSLFDDKKLSTISL
jgi:hypothetical protein